MFYRVHPPAPSICERGLSWEECGLSCRAHGGKGEREAFSLVVLTGSKEQGPAIWAALRGQGLCALLITN